MLADFDAFRVVLKYSLAILALPVLTFFVTKFVIFNGVFGSDNVTGNVYSAVCAVLVLHGALGMFIYKAYSQDSEPKMDKIKLDKAD